MITIHVISICIQYMYNSGTYRYSDNKFSYWLSQYLKIVVAYIFSILLHTPYWFEFTFYRLKHVPHISFDDSSNSYSVNHEIYYICGEDNCCLLMRFYVMIKRLRTRKNFNTFYQYTAFVLDIKYFSFHYGIGLLRLNIYNFTSSR